MLTTFSATRQDKLLAAKEIDLMTADKILRDQRKGKLVSGEEK